MILAWEPLCRIAVALVILNGVVACGGEPNTRSFVVPIAGPGATKDPGKSLPPDPAPNTTAATSTDRELPSLPPEAEPSAGHPAKVAPKKEPTLPTVHETAIGYLSPQEQTRHGKIDWTRWATQCHGKPLHHCPSGMESHCPPMVHNGKTYRVAADTKAPHFTVYRDKEAIYRGSIPANWAKPPIYTFSIWQDHWLLEVHDDLIVDGRSLNEERGYSRAFNWVLWHDQPMYFFEREHVIRIFYAGVVLPVAYDEVAHNLCCSEAIHDVTNCSEEVSFYAKRGPKWYYVQLAISESPEMRWSVDSR
jgi:hypothetical protein